VYHKSKTPNTMETRLQIDQVEPKGFQSLFPIEKYLQQTELTHTHKELIKIRASQINKCAFCIDMHTKDALAQGENLQRILLLNAWEETELFTPEEKILLKVTEEITLISEKGLSDATYKRAVQLLGENYLAQAIMAIIAINAWNRLSVSTLKPIPA
jgi:AhpD family alkylhydroperoxidase